MQTAQSSQPTGCAIQTIQLTRTYDHLVAVDHIDLKIQFGKIFGLLGPNGAGKSTTIKMLTTILPPTSGTATVGGSDIIHQPAIVRSKIGYVPQMLSADGALTGYENLYLSAQLYNMPRAERNPRIAEALAFMGLSDAAAKLVKNYSGGMIRRLEVAQAMLHRPIVLFLDEPTIGLDPIARQSVWERLIELNKNFKTTVLITTHDMEEADELCDELAIMHQGKIAAVGEPAALKAAISADATLNDVFIKFSGTSLKEGGNFRDINRTRTTASRLG